MRRLKNWLIRKLGAQWFVQTVWITGAELGFMPYEDFEKSFAKEVAHQKKTARERLLRDLEHNGHLQWIGLPRTGDDQRFILKLRVI